MAGYGHLDTSPGLYYIKPVDYSSLYDFMDKFKDLLRRFSKNTASQQEAEEFLRMSQKDKAAGEIEKHMDDLLARDAQKGLNDRERSESLQQIFGKKRI